jgi:hypothetical protein
VPQEAEWGCGDAATAPFEDSGNVKGVKRPSNGSTAADAVSL